MDTERKHKAASNCTFAHKSLRRSKKNFRELLIVLKMKFRENFRKSNKSFLRSDTLLTKSNFFNNFSFQKMSLTFSPRKTYAVRPAYVPKDVRRTSLYICFLTPPLTSIRNSLQSLNWVFMRAEILSYKMM